MDLTGTFLRNVAKEVARSAVIKEHNIDEQVAYYLLQTICLQPEYALPEDKALRRSHVELLLRKCENIISTSPPEILSTIQLFVKYNQMMREDLNALYHKELQARKGSLYTEIMTECGKSNDSVEKLLKLIILAALITADMGNPNQEDVLKEVTAALKSVVKISHVQTFTTFSRLEKESYLQYLSELVAGIRLYNQHIGQGGSGINNIPVELSTNIKSSLKILTEELDNVHLHIEAYTTALLVSYSLLGTKTQPGKDEGPTKQALTLSLRNKISDNIIPIKYSLIYLHQRAIVVKQLTDWNLISKARVSELINTFYSLLQSLKEIISYRTLVETSKVYPTFIQVGKIWRSLQVELYITQHRSKFVNSLIENGNEFYSRQISLDYFSEFEDTAYILTTEDLTLFHDAAEINNPDCSIVYPSEECELVLHLAGFCIVALVEWDGALVEGNPSLGVCLWNGQYYSFHSRTALYKFYSNPMGYEILALELVRKRIELVGLLKVYDCLLPLKNFRNLMLYRIHPSKMVDAHLQTDVHPLPSNKPRQLSYWERLRLLQVLATAVGSRTHSTQTTLTHSVETQSTTPRDAGSQTKRDGSSNVPRPQNFTFGLTPPVHVPSFRSSPENSIVKL